MGVVGIWFAFRPPDVAPCWYHRFGHVDVSTEQK